MTAKAAAKENVVFTSPPGASRLRALGSIRASLPELVCGRTGRRESALGIWTRWADEEGRRVTLVTSVSAAFGDGQGTRGRAVGSHAVCCAPSVSIFCFAGSKPHAGPSSNGRTPDFGSGNDGSNPSGPTEVLSASARGAFATALRTG